MSRVFFARSDTNGTAMGGMRCDAGKLWAGGIMKVEA